MSVMKIFRDSDAAAIPPSEENVLQSPKEVSLGGRNPVLDLMKGLLIALMVISHVHTGLNLNIPWLDPRRGVLQLTIFSGFIFAFGYGTYKAYLAKPILPRRRIIINILRILGAYYICAIAYGFFYDHSLSLSSILLALRLKSLVFFTEFLLPYAIILILILFVPRMFIIVTQKNAIFWPVIAGLLITTFFNYSQIHSVLPSLIIGSNTITSYPVVQYMPLYFNGNIFCSTPDKVLVEIPGRCRPGNYDIHYCPYLRVGYSLSPIHFLGRWFHGRGVRLLFAGTPVVLC